MSTIHSALVVDLSARPDILTQREFVWPIQRNLPVPSKVVHVSKLTPAVVKQSEWVVFSGCPLGDHAYVKRIPKLKWLARAGKPMLGICAGQHLLAGVFGGTITSMKTPAIGMHPLRVLKDHPALAGLGKTPRVYFLHGNEVSVPPAFSSIGRSAFSKNDILLHNNQCVVGLSFHPEVNQKSLFSHFMRWVEK